jgi:hypothetical protein
MVFCDTWHATAKCIEVALNHLLRFMASPGCCHHLRVVCTFSPPSFNNRYQPLLCTLSDRRQTVHPCVALTCNHNLHYPPAAKRTIGFVQGEQLNLLGVRDSLNCCR